MFFQDEPTSLTGTTTQIFIPRDANPILVRPGKGYFLVQIYSAQAAFTGAIWDKAETLVVTSQVGLNHPSLGSGNLRAIQRTRAIERNRTRQLGLSQNLVDLVPASMDKVSVSIEFIVDTENRLHTLADLINNDS